MVYIIEEIIAWEDWNSIGLWNTINDYSRVPRTDQILYQTERYHHVTFGYEIPVNKDGNYVLVLNFCEVYFSSPGMKVFDVILNGVHTIVSNLDIFVKDGKGVAPRWSATDVPQLPSLASDEKDEESTQEKKALPIRYPSGPRIPNPYETEDSSTMLPFIVIGAFLPLLFCLCRL
ncbi:malectin [Trichonephila inaurata madagascariensis]|uniref:Malectin n=1 Tax=Trichonephila inaurata madagascariensis TaxID=2747483 RepID=A0A8X6IHP6_9ARAC|nr:malectin [Trichonephila inaurata madagascariensis]